MNDESYKLSNKLPLINESVVIIYIISKNIGSKEKCRPKKNIDRK